MKSRKDALIVEHIKEQSLLSSSGEVKLLLTDRSIDVLGVSEIWLHANTPGRYTQSLK